MKAKLARIHWITSASMSPCPLHGAHLILECRRDGAPANGWIATITLHRSRN